MSSYKLFHIKPKEAPKFALWYVSCKEAKIDTVPYITAAIRYYAATNTFLSIGTVPEEKEINKETIGAYARETEDIVVWIENLKKQRIKVRGMASYVLEKSVDLVPGKETIPLPLSVELEILVSDALKGIYIPVTKNIAPGKEIIIQQHRDINVSESITEKVEKTNINNDAGSNIMDLPVFKGLT